jgi:hypothetical protein
LRIACGHDDLAITTSRELDCDDENDDEEDGRDRADRVSLPEL